MPTISDVVASKLAKAGIERVFGLPGGESVPLVAALQREGIEFVLVHNESSAVYMADATARLSGKPGVCLTTLGPGATNALAGVGHAFLDRAPVIIITATMWDVLRPQHTHQHLQQAAIFAPITKQTLTLTPENVHEAVDRALTLTMAGRPGPVHLQVSRQVAGEAAGSDRSDTRNELVVEVAATIDAREVQKARDRLAQAKRPLIIAGVGLEPERPYTALRAFAEAGQAPVIMTPKAKGAISAEHPLYAGTIGLTRTDPVYTLLAESDCIIAVGYDVVELVKPWNETETAPLIWVAPWANEDPTLPAEAELVGPLATALRELSQTRVATAAEWGATRVSAFHEMLAQIPLPAPAAGRMRPQEVLRAIHANVPRDTLLTTDVGSHKILTSLTWPSLEPNRFMLSNGLSCMGFGLPAAIAGSLALGRAPTVSIMGDGGLSMVIGELELITRLQTPVITVVMNDSALDLIRSAQRRTGNAAYGTEFSNPDFMLIAAAYGIAGRRVANEAECAAAVQAAIAENQPMLIEALIDPISYPTTPR